MTAGLGSRTAELFGLDTTAGTVQLGLGIGGLFASGLAAAVPQSRKAEKELAAATCTTAR